MKTKRQMEKEGRLFKVVILTLNLELCEYGPDLLSQHF
jgi:hypothetical protein